MSEIDGGSREAGRNLVLTRSACHVALGSGRPKYGAHIFLEPVTTGGRFPWQRFLRFVFPKANLLQNCDRGVLK